MTDEMPLPADEAAALASLRKNYPDVEYEIIAGRVRQLSLVGLGLDNLPSEVLSFTALTELEVFDNQLSALPEAIGRLTALTVLNLSNNRFSSLPEAIGQLTTLTELYVPLNQLSSLPEAIGRLTALRRMGVHNNQLPTLPESMRHFTRLHSLFIDNNRFTSLPKWLCDLPELSRLDVWDNPLPGYFPELLGSEEEPSEADVLAYVRDVLTDGKPQYSAKLVLVGNGRCGKSQLREALLGRLEPLPPTGTTRGVEISQDDVHLPHPDGVNTLTLHLWDFGGQETYEVTHQFFYSAGSVYLLIWRPSLFQPEDGLQNWLAKLRLRLGDRAKVLIVATHTCTDNRPVDLDVAGLQQKFPGMVLGLCKVDSLTTDPQRNGIPELKLAIAKAAAELPDMGRLISERWTAVRDALVELGKTKAFISRKEYDAIAEDHELLPAAADLWLRRLHDLGYVLHYGDEDGLKDFIVLTPDWITKAIARVLDDTQLLEQGGRLDHDRFPELWACHGEKEPRFDDASLFPFFHRLMERFDICIRHDTDARWSLVGEKVPHNPPAGIPAPAAERRIRLEYRLDEEPPGLIPWLIVRTYRFTSQSRHWRSGVYLERPPEVENGNPTGARIELNRFTRTLSLDVFGSAPDAFYHLLRDGIDVVLDRWPGLKGKVHRFIPCPLQKGGVPCPGAFELETLLGAREQDPPVPVWPCGRCYQPSEVAKLLTGFGFVREPLTEQLRAMLDQKFEQLFQKIEAGNDDILQKIAEAVGQIKQLLRATLRAITSEYKECPRLFTLWPKDAADRSWWERLDPRNLGQHTYELWLWCDHAEQPHPVKSYEVKIAADWVRKIAPYASVAAKVLRLGLAVFGAGLPVYLKKHNMPETELKAIKERLEGMQKFADKCLGAEIDMGHKKDALETGLTNAEGAAFREFAALLRDRLKDTVWGDLRCAPATNEGDIHWVCKEHYHHYDPGLIKLG